ncbi:hypothetical protein EDB92DRAFT_1504872 [Lactarius akahatsu]|uniref:Uncharacterized protein n=1 Tax=Lactarius akahatsu TaxID=416441 RepID=A0AAD4LDD0_9AGAM|nr:hypothetical protein EDB92DRAFT_1504872 [Lactarius akahatsu]
MHKSDIHPTILLGEARSSHPLSLPPDQPTKHFSPPDYQKYATAMRCVVSREEPLRGNIRPRLAFFAWCVACGYLLTCRPLPKVVLCYCTSKKPSNISQQKNSKMPPGFRVATAEHTTGDREVVCRDYVFGWLSADLCGRREKTPTPPALRRTVPVSPCRIHSASTSKLNKLKELSMCISRVPCDQTEGKGTVCTKSGAHLVASNRPLADRTANRRNTPLFFPSSSPPKLPPRGIIEVGYDSVTW